MIQTRNYKNEVVVLNRENYCELTKEIYLKNKEQIDSNLKIKPETEILVSFYEPNQSSITPQVSEIKVARLISQENQRITFKLRKDFYALGAIPERDEALEEEENLKFAMPEQYLGAGVYKFPLQDLETLYIKDLTY